MQIFKIALLLLVVMAAALGVGFVLDAVTPEQIQEWGTKGGVVVLILAATGLVIGLVGKPSSPNDRQPPSQAMK